MSVLKAITKHMIAEFSAAQGPDKAAYLDSLATRIAENSSESPMLARAALPVALSATLPYGNPALNRIAAFKALDAIITRLPNTAHHTFAAGFEMTFSPNGCAKRVIFDFSPKKETRNCMTVRDYVGRCADPEIESDKMIRRIAQKLFKKMPQQTPNLTTPAQSSTGVRRATRPSRDTRYRFCQHPREIL